MSRLYDPRHRALQDEFGTRAMADRIEELACRTEFDDDAKGFIEAVDMFFLSTVDARGRPTVSYKGGDPGFVRVLDGTTLVFPSYDGNGMFLSLGNVAVNPRVGMLFIDFTAARPSRLRVNGTASIDRADPLLASYPGAQLVVRVQTSEVFPNCPRYIHRMQLVERSRYVPQAGIAAPVPDWKRAAWACDVVPVSEPNG